MMDAVEFLKELKRRSASRPDYYGKELIIAYINPEALVAQVEQWSKERPIKTRQSEFLKMFPNTPLFEGVVGVDPCKVDETFECKYCGDCSSKCRRDYWLQEVE